MDNSYLVNRVSNKINIGITKIVCSKICNRHVKIEKVIFSNSGIFMFSSHFLFMNKFYGKHNFFFMVLYKAGLNLPRNFITIEKQEYHISTIFAYLVILKISKNKYIYFVIYNKGCPYIWYFFYFIGIKKKVHFFPLNICFLGGRI